MREIERNDVDINQLFRWNKAVEIEDKLTDQSVTLYLRLAGDADLNMSRTAALRASGDLRRNLKKSNSDARISFLSDIDEPKDKETLVGFCIVLHLEALQRKALADIDMPRPKEPKSDASQEEQEKYQQEVDEYPKKFGKAIGEEVERLRKVEQERLEEMTKKEIFTEYESLLINRLCHQEMVSIYYDHIVFHSTYSDPEFTVKTFETFEAFDNIASQVKSKLVEEYKSLEMGIDVVKKLPEAQQ